LIFLIVDYFSLSFASSNDHFDDFIMLNIMCVKMWDIY